MLNDSSLPCSCSHAGEQVRGRADARVERGLLVGVLAVAQVHDLLVGLAPARREILAGARREPGRDRRVVAGRARERLRRRALCASPTTAGRRTRAARRAPARSLRGPRPRRRTRCSWRRRGSSSDRRCRCSRSTSSSEASPRATVCSNGYRFTHTRSTCSIPCSLAARRCSSSSRRASSPAYRRGCSVFTRPSIISGKPVKSSIERTAIACAIELAGGAAGRDDLHAELREAVGELDDPALVGHRQQRPAHPHLARRRALDPGATLGHDVAFGAHCQQPIPRPHGPPRDRRSSCAGSRGRRAARRARTARPPAAAARARAGAAPPAPRRVARVRQLDRALQDHRPGVDAGVDEVDGHAEHLHAVRERLLDRAQPWERRQQRRVDVDAPRPGSARGSSRRAAPCSRPAPPAARPARQASRRARDRARRDRA